MINSPFNQLPVFLRANIPDEAEESSKGIPKTVNYVWITPVYKNTKSVIEDGNLLNTVLTHNMRILNEEDGYKHIIWTDNAEGIQNQVSSYWQAIIHARGSSYEYNNIEVRNIDHYMDHFPIFFRYHEKFIQLWQEHLNYYQYAFFQHTEEERETHCYKGEGAFRIFQQQYCLGTEIDLLKYSIANFTGGIIADLNFRFIAAPQDSDLAEFDFLINDNQENSFFASGVNNIFIRSILEGNEHLIGIDESIQANALFRYGFENYFTDIRWKEAVCELWKDDACYKVELYEEAKPIGKDAIHRSWFQHIDFNPL